LIRYFDKFLSRHGMSFSQEQWEILKLDLSLNADGIVIVAEKKMAPKGNA